MPRTKGSYNKSMRSSSAPRGFIPVGGTFTFGGQTVIVKKRPEGISPRDACLGCAYASGGCPNIQCSSFDRIDKTSVWFENLQYENE